ncbi:MAG TPA: hypothetical protein VFE65_11070 [Pseudonocardia sp.]|nr:hypothetical protein [Pseudonocardia sp.]
MASFWHNRSGGHISAIDMKKVEFARLRYLRKRQFRGLGPIDFHASGHAMIVGPALLF